ncbi:MAG: helix-turn-helix domain-containing protein [Chloroflexota bacterium]|nr:helix-turn-helix domain-containing protein [Chloroflexota bacterium]
MTSEEVAEVLHVDPVTIRRLVNKGELSAYRVGADYRFAPSDLQDYLQRQRISARTRGAPGASAPSPLEQFAQGIRNTIQGRQSTSGKLTDPALDGFTKRALTVLALAREEALSFQHNYIGTEHVLLGLVREGEGVAAKVLRNLHVDLEQVRGAVVAIIGRGDRIVLSDEVGITPRAKKVLALATAEMHSLNHRFVGTEHLLLGLIREGDGIAADVLRKLGVQLEQVRAETLRVLDQRQSEEAPAVPSIPPEAGALLAEHEQGLTCVYCGAQSPAYFRHCFNCGQALPNEAAGQGGED